MATSAIPFRRTASAHTVIVQRTSTAPLALVPRRRRDTVLARLVSGRLDTRLGRGDAPESGRLLAVRAAMLVDPGERLSLADAWDHVLVRASQPRRAGDPRVPVARGAVRAAGAEISALSTALRSASPVAARDVARARALLSDGSSPVYAAGRDLRAAVADVVAALTPAGRAG